MFPFGKGEIKLFLGVSLGLICFFMFMIPPDNWWFIWEYLETTPWLIVIGQGAFLWMLAFIITIFIILITRTAR